MTNRWLRRQRTPPTRTLPADFPTPASHPCRPALRQLFTVFTHSPEVQSRYSDCDESGRIIMTEEMNKTDGATGAFGHFIKRLKSANIGQGETCGYTEDSSEDRLQVTAEREGVKLYLNPDGSHLAVDESHSSYDD